MAWAAVWVAVWASLRAQRLVRCQGTITAITPQFMTLELSRPGLDGGGSCAGCDGRSGCGNGVFSSLFSSRPSRWRVPLLPGVRPGAQVEVNVPSRSLLALAFVAYLVPVISLLLCAIGADYLFGNQPLWVSLGGLSGLIGGVIAYPLLSGLVFRTLDCATEVSPAGSGQLDIAENPLIPHNQLS